MTEVRLRHVAHVNPASVAFDRLSMDSDLTFLPMEAVWADARLDTSRTRPKREVAAGFTRFQDGDVILPKITPTFEAGRSVVVTGLRNGVGAGTTELHVLRAGRDIDARYLAYVTQSHTFLKLGEGEMYGVAGQQRVPDDFVRNYRFHLPKIEDQKRTVGFLDESMAKLQLADGHVAKQAELMNFRRRALIENEMLDVRAKYPAIRIQFLARPSFESGRPDLPMLSVYRDHGVVPKDSRADNFNKTPEDVSRYLVVRPGDVVVNKMKAWQGSLAVSQHHGIVSPDYMVVRLYRSDLYADYLHYVLRSPWMISQYITRSVGIRPSQWRLYWDGFKEILVPCPPRSIQRAVVARLQAQDQAVESLILALSKRRALLEERRRGLITAAVAGELDMTTARGVYA